MSFGCVRQMPERMRAERVIFCLATEARHSQRAQVARSRKIGTRSG